MPCDSAPPAVPITMASTACQKLRPNKATASTPTKTVANSRLGEVQVQKSWSGFPCRSCRGMNSAPPGSTVMTRSPYSPSRTSTPAGASADASVVISWSDPAIACAPYGLAPPWLASYLSVQLEPRTAQGPVHNGSVGCPGHRLVG